MRKLQTQSGSYHQSVFSLSQGSNTIYYAKSAAPPIASTKQVTAEITAWTASLSDNSFSELSSCSENVNYASLPQNTNTLQHHASLPADSMKTWHNRHYQATGIENGAREYSSVSPTSTFDFTNFIQCQIPTASKTPDGSTNIDKVEEKRANGMRESNAVVFLISAFDVTNFIQFRMPTASKHQVGVQIRENRGKE